MWRPQCQAEQERIAAEKAERERIVVERAERERIVAEKAEHLQEVLNELNGPGTPEIRCSRNAPLGW